MSNYFWNFLKNNYKKTIESEDGLLVYEAWGDGADPVTDLARCGYSKYNLNHETHVCRFPLNALGYYNPPRRSVKHKYGKGVKLQKLQKKLQKIIFKKTKRVFVQMFRIF